MVLRFFHPVATPFFVSLRNTVTKQVLICPGSHSVSYFIHTIMVKKFILLSITAFLVICSYAQLAETFFPGQESPVFRKLYLHTDREYYFAGDTLWFSPYLVLGDSHKPLAENCNLYFGLIDSWGEVIEEKTFYLEDGICSGYLVLDNSRITPGNYVLRAYTDHLKPLGDDAFFQKTVRIDFARQSVGESTGENAGERTGENAGENAEVKKKTEVYIDFYPEGGFLLNGKSNKIAFVAHDQKGRPMDMEGTFVNSFGDSIPVKTVFKGTGCFEYTPRLWEKYSVEAHGYKKAHIMMPGVLRQGVELTLVKNTEDAVTFCISRSDDLLLNDYFIAVFHRGAGLNHVKIEKENLDRPVSISTEYLGAGINRFVLLNHQNEPVSERLVFIGKHGPECGVQIDMDKNTFKTGEQVNMKLSIPGMDKDEWARVSIAVVEDKMTGNNGNLQDIRTYLLLDSELRGQVQTPALYFIDDSVSSAGKLDLLMLTNGWRNYMWNYVKEKDGLDINYEFINQDPNQYQDQYQDQVAKGPKDRQTLYWNPFLVISGNAASVSFFTSDNLAYYKVFVEGITTSGKICTGVAQFVVNEISGQSF